MSAKIKLNAASGGGSFSLQAPSSSANNRVFTLPDVADGTIATTASAGKFASYAIICDQKGSGVDSGTFTSGDWRHRDLNTEIADSDGIVSISSNLFTLQAGTYLILASAGGHMVGRHQIRLYNNTDSAVAAYGSSEYANSTHHMTTRSFLQTRIVISGAKAFKIEHRGEDTRSNDGFGESNDWSSSNQFTQIEIYKES